MSLQPRRRALLVTGMHRSGTSCATRIASLTGLVIGTDLLSKQPDNPHGFWEHAELSRLNEEILSALGTTWDALAPLPTGWQTSPEVLDAKGRLSEIIRREFPDEKNIVIKDPRICLLVPLWCEVLAGLGFEPEFLVVVRDVNAVVASLRERNSFSDWQSELLWLRYNLNVEFETRTYRRALVHYEDLIQDWRSALGKVAGNLALDLPAAGTERADAIDEFVSPSLNHAPEPNSETRAKQAPWITDVTGALKQPSAFEDAQSLKTLDRVRAEVLAGDPLYSPQDSHWRNEFLRLKAETDAATHHFQKKSQDYDQLRSLVDSGIAAGKVQSSLEQRLDAISQHLESTQSDTSVRDFNRQIFEKIDSIANAVQHQNQRQLESLTAERDEIFRREAQRANSQRDIEQALARTEKREASLKNKLEVQETEIVRAKYAISEAEVAHHESQKVAQREIDELRAEVQNLESHLENTRNALNDHSQVISNFLSSRSWKITKPLRSLTSFLDLEQGGLVDPALRRPVPWHELLPGRPFRQRFQSPLAEIAGLGVLFFSYGRENRSSVRVRIFEERPFPRSNRLLEEVVFRGHEIQDGKTCVFGFPKRIREADQRSFVLEIESLDGQPGASVTVGVGLSSYTGKILSRDHKGEPKTKGLLVLEILDRVSVPRKAVAFISGCPGGAYRYRCEHPAEILRLRGYSVDVIQADHFPWSQLLDSYQLVIAHRVPHTPEFEHFIEAAKNSGIRVFYDTDDLVFAPEVEDQIAALDEMPPVERDLWLDGVKRYRKSLTLLPQAIVSTPGLKQSLENRLETRAFVSRNRVTTEMVNAAEAARPASDRVDNAVRIGYMSGTPTHRRDFAQCIPALAEVMQSEPNIRLALVGHIDTPYELTAFKDRIDRVPLVPWQELPRIYANMDISLAPLELHNEFTAGKSELKYFEAGLLSVPTVASRVGSYIDAIRHGDNGYLCETQEEWVEALKLLTRDPKLRQRIGEAAREDVHARYTTRASAAETVDVLLEALGQPSTPAPRLRIAMIMRAPIANTGGGYKKLFHLVKHLSGKGHEITIYAEPIAHLEGKTSEEMEAFCRGNFDCGGASIVSGHNEIEDCDVAIATNWPTAYVVSDLENARQKFYFIQDDEAEFYDQDDANYELAAATYRLPLLMVGIGEYLSGLIGARNGQAYPHVDFALDEVFFERRSEAKAKAEALIRLDQPSLLFFARPGIPRRAFELGVQALKKFQQSRPDVEIRLYGLDRTLDLDFEYTDLGIIDQAEVAIEMRKTSVHLSFSRTNASTVIFEAMASGAVAVELDVESVRSLIRNPNSCVLCKDSPDVVAETLINLFENPDKMARIALAGLESVSSFTVANMCEQFEEILLRHSLTGRAQQ